MWLCVTLPARGNFAAGETPMKIRSALKAGAGKADLVNSIAG